jgi:hypothetical protein
MDKGSARVRITPGEKGKTSVTLWYEGQLIEWTRSHRYEAIAGVEAPAWVSQRVYGSDGGPDMFVKVAVRDGSPEVVELSIKSRPGQSEVRQKHLRAIDLEQLVTELYATEVSEADHNSTPAEYAAAKRIAEKFVERQRRSRDYRIITNEFLMKVAEVYRENIHHAPTKAVARHFGVRDRMASTYVDRARKAGHLPPTKQGQKKA